MNTTLINRATAISSLKPGALWTDNNGVLEWDSSNSQIKPTESEIAAEIKRLDYSRNREAAYPNLQEQLDLQYWDQVNGTTKWKDAIAKVKNDNPKP
jgi:hypothetical protein